MLSKRNLPPSRSANEIAHFHPSYNDLYGKPGNNMAQWVNGRLKMFTAKVERGEVPQR